MARSLKYTKELVQDIVKYIKSGLSNKDSAVLAGISEPTFYLWQKENNPDDQEEKKNPLTDDQRVEFVESLKKAELERKQALTMRILKASDESWQAGAWYLERVYNEEFAKRQISQIEDKDKSEGVKLLRKLLNGDNKKQTKGTADSIQDSE